MHPASRVVVTVMVAVELVVTIAGTWTYARSAGRVIDADRVPAGSTVVVLGSLVHDGVPGDYVRGRLDTALKLYRSGRVARILVSGNGSPDAGDEPAVMRDYLVVRGVPASMISSDQVGMDTAMSCRRVHDVFHLSRAVLVTQDFHLPRAIALCRGRGVDAVGVVAGCSCPVWTVVRNHLREMLFSRPRALLD